MNYNSSLVYIKIIRYDLVMREVFCNTHTEFGAPMKVVRDILEITYLSERKNQELSLMLEANAERTR
jgi:hypothetical protein